jgi:hypothetical protein
MQSKDSANRERLLELLADGPMKREALDQRLGWSQPTFSRRVRAWGDAIVVAGRGPATLYAARRSMDGVGDQVPLFELDARGQAEHVATLHPTRPAGFLVESHHADLQGGFFPDLPWFLDDQRPAGFLGRLLPRRFPEWPTDIGVWSGTHVLRWLVQHGGDEIGAFVVGEQALERAQRATARPLWAASERVERFPVLAEQALLEPAGSSAAGEQPKFLVKRLDPHGIPVATLVKFSPVRTAGDAVAQRMADLLVAEHLVHATLREAGRGGCWSDIIEAGGRIFLEVQRFDRTPAGRHGVLSLSVLDHQFVGRLRSWLDTAQHLEKLRILDANTVAEIAWRGFFGRCIANTDMHHGNLSLLARGTRIVGLAPSYDMLPMAFMPRHGNLVTPGFQAPTPLAAEAPFAEHARSLAIRVWQGVAAHALVSPSFQALAADIARRLADV